ncbi:MAG: chorismate-binding protein [Tropheryma whipplei]|nr:chorismate-binding protein [Tropheryma whipplei]MCO8182673.1 chorismate-binding protein [Tropheryma whipplei]MCO8190369.1 chorismate-binding protein [Tropheryma whipplei]CAD66749.1 putative chorismate binding enzyme [Tropheryma whipplei TW08/27]
MLPIEVEITRIGNMDRSDFKRQYIRKVLSWDFVYCTHSTMMRTQGRVLKINLDSYSAEARFEAAESLINEIHTKIQYTSENLNPIGLIVLFGFTFSPYSARPSFLAIPEQMFFWSDGVAWKIDATICHNLSEPSRIFKWPKSISFKMGDFRQEDYKHAITNVVNKLLNADISKVVLARDIIAEIHDDFDPEAHAIDLDEAIQRLMNTANGTVFVFDGLFGASPEVLLRTDGNSGFEVSILAGSMSANHPKHVIHNCAASPPYKALDETYLDEKLRLEHSFALNPTLERLSTLMNTAPTVNSYKIRRFTHITHVASFISGTFKPNISPLRALSHIHPTGAIAGEPRERALEIIKEIEPFDRELYGGAIGWIGQDSSCEFTLPIRCAQLNRGHIKAFAGCGIVKSSIPQKELEESTLKFKTIIDAIS